jgi:hypothetical protein
VDAETWATTSERLKQDLLGLVEVVEVRAWGVERCVLLSSAEAGLLGEDRRAQVASAFQLALHQVRPGAAGLYLSVDPNQLPADWASFKLDGHPKPLGEWASVAPSWCDAVAVRRLEIVVDSGVRLSEVRSDLDDLLGGHPGAQALGLRLP